MKLRIKGSSLRLRLTQGEVTQLETQGEVEERVEFGAGPALAYRLAVDDEIDSISATYVDNLINIRIPKPQALQWCRSRQVTLAHTQSLAADELRISIEKDFACLAAREGEDESDNFPHPRAIEGETC